MTNTNFLKAKMVLHGDTIQTLAAAIGINRQNASLKINGKRCFKQNEIALIAWRYKLNPQEFKAIFFCDDFYDERWDMNECQGMCRVAR